jgi:hypothetical protein
VLLCRLRAADASETDAKNNTAAITNAAWHGHGETQNLNAIDKP